ncbi:hypothetical protein GF312_22825 [Candidatus Poribacteria bacterium]|nr:hypothetical protein [Candidatus Poribacteria bacterium]
MKNLLIAIALLTICFVLMGCVSVPHIIWPQKDIKAKAINEPTYDKKVLIASRSSDFKDVVVKKLVESFKDEKVFIKLIGMENLEEEDGNDYNAVVMLNTCMAWDMDRNVKKFLKKHDDQSNMIILTTSGDGDWLPKKDGQNFDAISSASKKANIDKAVGDIAAKVQILLGNA